MEKKARVVQKNVSNGVGAVYCLGLIGALVYFIQQANSFWEVIIGILKAIVWPAFVIYGLLDFLRI